MSAPNLERREVLMGLYRDGLTYKQIAQRYGGTPLGVRSTLAKMRGRGLVGAKGERFEWPVPR